jgi:valyl-tRNA synthetase
MSENTESIQASLTALPDHVGVDGLEDKWCKQWEEKGTYRFRNTAERKASTPSTPRRPRSPAHLHVGHVFSYTHTDVIAATSACAAIDVFYPMGWDDNGLPTERRVQNYYGVRVDTSLRVRS